MIQPLRFLIDAGVRAAPLAQVLAERQARPPTHGGIIVEPDLSIPYCAHIFAIGDLANYAHQTGAPLPVSHL